MAGSTYETIGCASFCKTGEIFEEHFSITSFRAIRLRTKARAYIEKHPCRFVVDGSCRLDEFLVRDALGSSLKEARVEAVDRHRGEQ